MIRQYERLLKEYLAFFPCAALIGPRQCGKTTLLQTLPKDWKVIDLEKQSDFQSLAQDPDLFFRLNPDKIAIDEAQLQKLVSGDPLYVELDIEDGYVILSFEGDILGLGLLIEGKILSQIPRNEFHFG